jgi:hypothetical protein
MSLACALKNQYFIRYESNQLCSSHFVSDILKRCSTMYGTGSYEAMVRF